MPAPIALRDRAQERVGKVLNDKWHIDGLLGIGGMAAVYCASHRNGKRAAVKVLHRELVADTSLVTRFLREGYLANRVGHPGVVGVLDDEVADDGAPYLVMDLLDGYSLEKHTQNLPMAMPVILAVIDELLDVLAAAHAAGIVHRDIKPANVFVTREGKVKVLDFGIARLSEPNGDSGTTQTGTAIGTPAYMPPEQARGRWTDVDARSDLWAVAATMLGLAIGHRPRNAETVQEELLLAMTQPMPPAATICPALSPAVAKVLDSALAFDRRDRFPDARAMQLALRRALDASAAGGDGHTLVVSVPAMDSAPVVLPGGDPSRMMTMPIPQRGGGTLEIAEQELASGRTVSLHQPASPARSPRTRTPGIALAAGAALVVVIAVPLGWTRYHARPHAAASLPPPPAMTLPASEVEASSAPSSAAATPSNATSASPPEAIVARSAAAQGSARTRRPSRPAPSDTASLFDRRF